MGIPEGEERAKGNEDVFEEIMAENSTNPKKKIDIQIQEAQMVPNKINPNRLTPRYIIIKMGKIKERILKAARVDYKGIPIRLSAYFSTEMLQVRREWHNIFKVLKEKNLQPAPTSKIII